MIFLKHQKTHFQVPYDHLFLNDHSTLQDKYFFHEIDAVSESKKTLFLRKAKFSKVVFCDFRHLPSYALIVISLTF